MNKLFQRLKISQKLNLIGYVGVFGLIISSISVWFILNNVHELNKNIQNYASIEKSLWSIRSNYNAINRDLLLLYVLDPNVDEQLTKSNETFEHYLKTIKKLEEDKQKLLEEGSNDTDLKPLINKINTTIQSYTSFVTENVIKIKNVSTSDSLGSVECKDILFNKFEPLVEQLRIDREALFQILKSKIEKANEDFETANRTANILVAALTIFVIIIVYVLSSMVSKNISNRLKYVSDTLDKVSGGDLPEVKTFDDKDEIGVMSHSFTNLVLELNKLKQFTVAVGNGNYESDIEVFKNKGEISNALTEMKANLKIASDLKNIQNYTSEGLAKFSNILRNTVDEDYYDNILSNLVKYLKANQGGLFIIEEKNREKYLNLAASYAYDKKKFLEKTLLIGEGLAGQCVLEKETIILTEVPNHYVNITSGLGQATPSAIVIVPLKINNEVVGVIELASFNEFQQYEIEFIEKVAENIASAIISAKTNQRTKELLEISQQQTEEMRAQEEEMRQNLEEMQATQEEMERKEREMHSIIDEVQKRENELREYILELQSQKAELENKLNKI
jgi:methyl-accepting chemotaxis protein